MDYIIVQAGGKGTRLKYLTKNKPKALLPVENLPMLFHLFKKFPSKRFIIIGDYKKEVLREYLYSFAKVKYEVVDTSESGTCSGINLALDLIPAGKSFMLIWSDLILSEEFSLPKEYENPKVDSNYIGISKTFQCRWSYVENEFVEEKSYNYGVAGLFLFKSKEELQNVPKSGEFVKWLKDEKFKFKELPLNGTREFGLIEEYKKLSEPKCRPFNKIQIGEDFVIKEGIDLKGEKLAKRENAWYEKAKEMNIDILPKIYSVNPLKMERIKGKNIYEYNLPYNEKKEILKKLIEALHMLHNKVHITADSFSCKEAYFRKTFDRINPVRDMIPFADKKIINVNGRKCRNVFFYKRELEKKIENLKCQYFSFIHGDCTFSNMMLREDKTPVLIDPRGYFGFTELYGDPLYDWGKLYYSIVGNYDKFNLKKFRLSINEDDVQLDIESNNFEDMEDEFFYLTGAKREDIKLIHSLIWLSLTTYAWQDYDSICGAFYNGLYYLEEIL